MARHQCDSNDWDVEAPTDVHKAFARLLQNDWDVGALADVYNAFARLPQNDCARLYAVWLQRGWGHKHTWP